MSKAAEKKRSGKVLDFIERVGNRLPHPYIMFLWLCLILAVISTVCSMAGCQRSAQQRRFCMAVTEFAEEFPGFFRIGTGSGDADGDWIR